jgi:hypothetical protein
MNRSLKEEEEVGRGQRGIGGRNKTDHESQNPEVDGV